MRNLLLSIMALLPLSIQPVSAQTTKVIAHRGYWKTEGSAQNSIASLRKAIEIGVYGSEFDVWLTADNIPILNHDAEIGGFRVETTKYKELKNIRLSNGEKIPTLKQYLNEGKKQNDTKLILEIKAHSTPERNREAAQLIISEVEKSHTKELVEYITFSLDVAKELVRLDPTAIVSYLNGELAPAELKIIGISGVDYHFDVMRRNPKWFDQAAKFGVSINVWTVNTEIMMKEFIDQKTDLITTDEPVLLQKVLKY